MQKYINLVSSYDENSTVNENDYYFIEMIIREMVIFGKANELEYKGDHFYKLVSNLQNNLDRITPGLHQNFYNQPHILKSIQLLIEESEKYINNQNIPKTDPHLLPLILNKITDYKIFKI